MQPFERLRYIARHAGADRTLVAEAADCLAEFDDEPAGLVVTCRRLLQHHPDCAPLWWLCARVLAAPDPSDAAWDAEALVRDDRTPSRLAALLPFPADHPVVVLGWPELIGEALSSRPDLEVLAVRQDQRDESWRARLARSDASARPVDVMDAVACEPSHVLVEVAALGASPTGSPAALVAAGTEALLADLVRPTTLVWLVAGVGRVLPTRLFDALLHRLEPSDRSTLDPSGMERFGLERLDLQIADRIAGPTGLDRPDNLARRVDCPVAPELLRPI
jgi:hypothetical protein